MRHLQLSLNKRGIALSVCATFTLIGIVPAALAADINRKLVAELDPVAPTSSIYEEQKNGVATSKWGGNIDFNLAGVLSVGPEFWTGTFSEKGAEEGETYRREDMWPGERQKIDAIRLRWMATAWEQPSSMRGWFVKGGYSYTRINSRANRLNEAQGDGSDAIPVGMFDTTPDDQTDLVTDIRHGIAAGFGNRWMMFDQKVTVTLGTSFTSNFKRIVSVDSKDPNARGDYDSMIETLADTRMTTRPTPEINLGLGYAW